MDIKKCFASKNIAFGLLILAIIFLLIKMTDIALLLFCSYVISSAINPFVDKMEEKMPRSVATTLMILLITAVTLGVFIPIIIMSVNEIKEFLNQLPQQIQNIQHFLATFRPAGQDISQYFNIETVLDNSTNIAKEVIDYLIEKGAAIYYKNNVCRTPMDLLEHKIKHASSENKTELEDIKAKLQQSTAASTAISSSAEDTMTQLQQLSRACNDMSLLEPKQKKGCCNVA